MKITLACIVGNEEAVIERFIRSFAPAVDEFVFVRAVGNQNPDNTCEIVSSNCAGFFNTDRTFGKTTNLVFEDYKNKIDLPHVDNFGAARQQAWDAACADKLNTGKPDYVLWADADDVLSPGAAEAIRAAAESASHDVFIMPYHVRGDKQVVMRERMVKASIGSHWQYPIHEQLAFPKDVTYKIVKDAIFVHSPLAEKSGSHARNVAILKNEVKDTWRNFFYLSQEYFQTGDDRQFIRYANAALACPGLEKIERYEILLNLAQTPGQDSRKLAAEAFAIMPDRREALALLCSYSLIDQDYDTALTLARKMVETDHPKRSYWSQNNEWYGWKGAELYRQCLRLTGDHDEADTEFALNIDEDRPIETVYHEVTDLESALQYREFFLSNSLTPQNVDFTFRINPDDSKSLKMLSGFKHEIIQPELQEVGS